MSTSPQQPPRLLLVRCPGKGSAAVEARARVLVLDEHLRYAETLARLSSTEAYTVRLGTTAPSKRDELVRDAAWANAAVCDMSDPSNEKVAALAQLRRLRPDLSWIVCTSTPDHPAVKTMAKHGHTVVLAPFTSRELRGALGRAISKTSGFEMKAVGPRDSYRRVG